MTTFALVLGAVLAIACVVFVSRPFLREPALGGRRRPPVTSRTRPSAAGCRSRRSGTAALAALKELEFDHRTGKVSDEDYRALVGPLRRQAAEALRALDG